MTTEVEPPASGTLRKILIPEAETVPIVKVIGHILEPGGEVPQEWPIPEPVKEAVTPTPAVTPRKVLATSAAKRMAQERGVDLTQIEGTVERGAIIREDVLRFVEEICLSGIEGSGSGGRRTGQDILDFPASQELITPSAIQRVRMKRMSESFTATPHFCLTVGVQATRLVEWRERLIPIIGQETGVRLTFTVDGLREAENDIG